ncbi:MAG TPA: nucleoside-diphosphate kinase [Planctomycetota bacterium]|nr:nucleoside-diphosphate kinase [Planctomycetota bacterium]
MAIEIAHTLITPYSLLKSRTGGIIGRLLAWGELELAGARIYAPDDAFVDAYLKVVGASSLDPAMKAPLEKYLDENLRPANRMGISNRTLALFFRGENAFAKLHNVLGPLELKLRGDNIRGTYGDMVVVDGKVQYFEPAVLGAADAATERAVLALLAERAESCGGVVEHAVKLPPEAETTLVMLKPDLFAKRSSRPGNIIDMFSRTGLYMVGARLVHMSLDQANEFYGPLRQIFVNRLKFLVERKLREGLKGAFQFEVTDADIAAMAEPLKDKNAEWEFNQIVSFMTGRDPYKEVSAPARKAPGRSTCLALLYRGVDAVNKIRERLGPTNPKEAAGGTVRSDYGSDLMRNGAHASDSAANAVRERKIIGLSGTEPSAEAAMIREFLAGR